MKLLAGKAAIVYGAGGLIGSNVAKSFARDGAQVFLTGRTITPLAQLAHEIRETGGRAEAEAVDATSKTELEVHAQAVLKKAGHIDIVFNATSNEDLQGIPLIDMKCEDFFRPVEKALSVHYLISSAIGRHMVQQGHGVILCMAGGREAIPNLGGSHVAWSALAGLCRQFASEGVSRGVRVLWMLSPGSPEPEGEADEDTGRTLLGRLPSYEEVAEVATFLASDRAKSMTATEVNITGGAVVD